MKKSATFSTEVREHSVRMVYELRKSHSFKWAAIEAVPKMIFVQLRH